MRHHVAEAGDQRDQRRLIDVAQGRMVPAGDEVQLVAKVTVAKVGGDVEREGGERQRPGPGRALSHGASGTDAIPARNDSANAAANPCASSIGLSMGSGTGSFTNGGKGG